MRDLDGFPKQFPDLVDRLVEESRAISATPGTKSEISHYVPFDRLLNDALALLAQARKSADSYSLAHQAGANNVGVPDFRVQREKELQGWVEVKAVVGKDLNHLTGHDAAQMERFVSGLDNVLYTTGWQWRLYQHNQQVGPEVVLGPPTLFDPEQLHYVAGSHAVAQLWNVLELFVDRRTQPYPSASAAVQALAARAKALKLALLAVGREGAGEHLQTLERDFKRLLFKNGLPFTWEKFVDSYVQLASFGLLLWRLESGSQVSLNHQVGLQQGLHPLLAQCLTIMWNRQSRRPILEPLLEELCRTVNNIEPSLFTTRSGDAAHQYVPDPIVHAYEPFFEAYDPASRDAAGVYYTPAEIVQHIVSGADHLVRTSLARPDGVLSEDARFLDPATGTGTFLLGLANKVAGAASSVGLPVDQMVLEVMTNRSAAFELFPGPYALAHQRLEVALRSFGATPTERLPIFLADTLAAPVSGTLESSGFGLAGDEIQHEREAADRIKTSDEILVIMGNPPYERVLESKDGSFEPFAQGLLDEIRLATPPEYRADLKSTKDLYVAFWAWALWALQSPAKRQASAAAPSIDTRGAHGMVAFITNRTWISGRSLTGLRRLVQRGAKEIWICDLGGDARGAHGAKSFAGGDGNVFGIRTGVAIAWIVFDREFTGDPAIRYRRLFGTARSKLAAMERPFRPQDYQDLSTAPGSAYLPSGWGDSPAGLSPALPELFADPPETGTQTARDKSGYTPIATEPHELLWVRRVKGREPVLQGRLGEWSRLSPSARSKSWATAEERRRNAEPPRPEDLEPSRIRPYAYRPLDQRYIYHDPKWITWSRPVLDDVYSPAGTSVPALVTIPRDHGAGPIAMHVAHLMDQHAFNNRGAKGVFTLWRPHPQGARAPHARTRVVDGWRSGLSALTYAWMDALGGGPDEEHVYDYMLCLLTADAYAEEYWRALMADDVRVPLTLDLELFNRGASIGAKIRRAWELQPEGCGKYAWTGLGSGPLGRVRIDGSTLHFASGREITGVTSAIWDYEVSGYKVVRRWFAAREHWTATVSQATQALTVLHSVDDLLEHGNAASDVLAAVMKFPLFGQAEADRQQIAESP